VGQFKNAMFNDAGSSQFLLVAKIDSALGAADHPHFKAQLGHKWAIAPIDESTHLQPG
jgi:hypothetical protein